MLLVDTNVVIWLAGDVQQLSTNAQQAMSKARGEGSALAIAGTTLWEIATLSAKGKLSFFPSVDSFLSRVESRYHILPMTREIALVGSRFSAEYPRDPADRQIGATALVNGLPLITADKAIRASGEVPCIW